MAQAAGEADAVLAADLERAHRLEQRARSFRIRRDRYFEPLPDQHLVVYTDLWLDSNVLTDDHMVAYLGFGPPPKDFFMVYRPKDGDYRILQRFSSSLVRFADEIDEEFNNELGRASFIT